MYFSEVWTEREIFCPPIGKRYGFKTISGRSSTQHAEAKLRLK
jgi:hypothetical protein